MDPEHQFQRELEVFRTETETASQFLFGFFAVHAVAFDRKPVHKLLNTAPLFWDTVLGALQTSAHIALGRIFDQDSAHNVDRILHLAQQNPQIFSKQALGKRKEASSSNAAEWLGDYLKTAYEPIPDDFRRLRKHVARRRKIYEIKYRDIRHRFFAHKLISDRAEVDALFAKTSIQELRRLFVFLQSLREALWELFNNGRKPILRPVRYSVQRMRDLPSPKGGRDTVQERITHEAEQFLRKAAGDTSKKRPPTPWIEES
jgi:AbiU2